MECRRARKEDFDKVVELQDANLVSVLTEDAKADGFLSGSFDAQQYSAMNDDVCVVVAREEGKLLGFLAVGSPEFNKSHSLPAAMISMFPKLEYRGKNLDQYQCCIAGPVCVDKDARGKGVFQALYEELHRLLPENIDLITTLVSTSNPRSLRAHEKVGLELLTQFEHQSRQFNLLVCAARKGV